MSNHVLSNIDECLDHRFMRFADDYRVFCDTRDDAIRALELLRRQAAKLGLSLNRQKTRLKWAPGDPNAGLLASRGKFLEEDAMTPPDLYTMLHAALQEGSTSRVIAALRPFVVDRTPIPDEFCAELERFVVERDCPALFGFGLVRLASQGCLRGSERFIEDDRLDDRHRLAISLYEGTPAPPELSERWPRLTQMLQRTS